VEKYATAGQATDDSIVRCMRVACWITRATDLHSEYVILIAFLRQRMLKRRRLMLRLDVMYCALPVVLIVDCWPLRAINVLSVFETERMFLPHFRGRFCGRAQ
jgi:hypothetical protein